jgi:hypothetical protein
MSSRIAAFSRMSHDFISFCESLWQDWLAGKLETSSFVSRAFDMDAAPEPYIVFGSVPNALIVLTTNPGKAMPHQRRKAVQAGGGGGPLSAVIDYATAAKTLGAFYERQLAGRPAGRRIAAMRALSALVGAEGVVQVEACPFHSWSLPDKMGLLQEIDDGGLLTRYVQQARAFLIPRPVVAISAAPFQMSLGPEVARSRWVVWLSELAGLNLKDADLIPLVTRGEKVTALALRVKRQQVSESSRPHDG